jgi:hypothetical protein
MSDIEVTDVPEANRFEARMDGVLAGHAEYILTDELVVFSHTEVNPAFEGKGVGSALVRHSLDDARRRGLAVLPVCPFYKSWIEGHPDYADVVYRPPASRVTD